MYAAISLAQAVTVAGLHAPEVVLDHKLVAYGADLPVHLRREIWVWYPKKSSKIGKQARTRCFLYTLVRWRVPMP